MVDIEKLGRYDIIRVLGKGAMGVVYEGRDPNLDRVVAIKTIRVQSLTPEAAREYEGRFRTEARSAARLHHPNIVSVFDSGQDGGIAYLVMEFINGEDLKQHLECGARFSVRSSIVMVHELLMALDHAHRQNVVHRDIKPANMLMEVSGRIKLTDFGVARIQEPDETNLTQVGGAVGTPKYMSPEQARGLRGDSRSDVFSAAVVLYELLTGTLPFTGDNQFIVIHQIVSQDAKPPSSLNPEVPTALDDVLARAMAKNPDERYATARDFAVALRTVAQQMNASPAAAGGDVAAELGQFLASRSVAVSSALRDGSSTGIFGPSLEAALNTTVNHEAELGAWNAVRDSSNAPDFLKFLASFPAGIYARRAQNRVYQLGAGDALQDAKTEPQYRPLAGSSGFESTVGYNDVTRPSQPTVVAAPEPEQPLALPDLAQTITATPEPKVKVRRVWPLIAGASVLFCLVVLFLSINTDTLVPHSIQAVPALPVEPVASVPVAPSSAAIALPAAPAPAASAASAALQASAPKPASKPRVIGSAASAPAEPMSVSGRAAPVKPPQREAAPAAATQGQVPIPQPISGPGPSMSGQACEDRVFIFKITCIAAQCQTDRYRHTAECVQFKEMEREREEQQRNSRR
jgi:serine/threonine-protein kinase